MGWLRRGSGLGLAGLLFLGVSGCAYHGESTASIDNPAVQKFSWFSFLDGSDIRQACAALGPKAPDRYRLVYNGQYTEQLRAYEINLASSGTASLLARVKVHSNLADWWIQSFSDLLAPWRWREATAALSAGEVGQFRALLAKSGYGAGAPQGLRLPSQDFYWVVSGCTAGKFHFYAWRARNGRLDQAPFQDFLLRHDGTGVPFRPPHVLDIAETERLGTAHGRNFNGEFTLEVRGEGIGGLVNAF